MKSWKQWHIIITQIFGDKHLSY